MTVKHYSLSAMQFLTLRRGSVRSEGSQTWNVWIKEYF
jgi:hypothetical protein